MAHRVKALGGFKALIERFALGLECFKKRTGLPERHETRIVGGNHPQGDGSGKA